MGVLGLTPFLQRHFPQVVKELPERLRDFAGKTIVFDGTLITHRFHFAPSPLEYRHVLGWYKLITELRDNNVNAICVFDGAGRSAAKVLENEKRATARRLVLARWSMEVKRQERLKCLKGVLDKARRLPLEQRSSAMARLRAFIGQRSVETNEGSHFVSEESSLEVKDIEGQPISSLSPIEPREEAHLSGESEDSPISPAVFRDAEQVFIADDSLIRDQDFLYLEHRLPPSVHHNLSEQLSALYASHEASSKTIWNIAHPIDVSTSSPEEASESRIQLALSADEDVLWSKIQSSIAEPRYIRTPPLLINLIQRSRALADNYNKRSKPPTQETYRECKMILDALGVPCVQSSGPYEAEGLAAALVRRGLAHFVASEDTDVLVYGAPLLRNISSRNGAIVCISSEEVRRALGLSRAAFMDFALLIGTDFVPRLRNVGPVRALSFISAHSRIERVVRRESRYIPQDVPDYLKKIRRARAIFSTLPLLVQFGLSRAALESDWDPQTSLGANYFADDPLFLLLLHLQRSLSNIAWNRKNSCIAIHPLQPTITMYSQSIE